MTDVKEAAQQTLYAAVGTPVLVKDRIVEFGTKMVGVAKDQFKAAAQEGEQIASNVRKSTVVEEISSRIDLEDLQGRVDKLRDQLEEALANWRESFRPEAEKEQPKPAAVKAEKPAAKKPAAKATTTRKPAAKKPAAGSKS